MTKLVCVAVLLLAAAVSCSTKEAAASCKTGSPNCMPDVTYVDTNGTAYTPQSLAGKVVIVNFWATWCKPCIHEIPDLSRVYDEYKARGVMVLGVLNDNPDNSTLLNFKSDNDMTFPVVRANSDIMTAYNYPQSLPTTFIFDRSGRQVHVQVGALRADKLASIIEPLVKAERKPPSTPSFPWRLRRLGIHSSRATSTSSELSRASSRSPGPGR